MKSPLKFYAAIFRMQPYSLNQSESKLIRRLIKCATPVSAELMKGYLDTTKSSIFLNEL